MHPSSTLPGSRKQNSSFGCVDWLSQSSHAGRLHTSRPGDVSWGELSVPARVSSSWETAQTVGMEELKSSEASVPGTSTAGRSGSVCGGGPFPDWGGSWRRTMPLPHPVSLGGTRDPRAGVGVPPYPLASESFPSEAQATRGFPPHPWGSSSLLLEGLVPCLRPGLPHGSARGHRC